VDPIALILPDASLGDQDLANRLTRALCIFSSDAADSGSPSVHVQLDSARDELGLYHAGTIGSLLQDLLIHVAVEAMVGETYLLLPVPRRTYSAAWSQAFATTTEKERRQFGLQVPAAAAPPLDVLGSLVDGLEQHAQHSREAGGGQTRRLAAELWRIRYERIVDLADGREPQSGGALETLLGRLSRMRGAAARSLRVAILGDLVALHLDNGQLVAASEAVRRAGPTAPGPAECRGPMDVLSLMIRWLMEEGELPDLGAAIGRCTATGIVPPGWQQLVGHCRSGWPSSVGARPAGDLPRDVSLSRRSLGATAIVVSAIQPGGLLKVLHKEIAPGLNSHFERWSSGHRAALLERGTPEHEVGCRAAPVLLVRAEEVPDDKARIAASCIARRRSNGRASRERQDGDGFDEPAVLVVQPILDGDGEPAGLVWLECPTRLLPSARAREALARAFGKQHLFARGARTGDVLAPRTPIHLGEGASAAWELPGALDRGRAASRGLRGTWESAVGALKLKTAERRWIAFHAVGNGGELQMVATGGDAGDRLGQANDEGAWAIRRSLLTGGAVRYGVESAEVTMLHPGAISGAAIPLHRGGRVIAVLSLESARRGDAREVDVERWFDTLQLSGPAVEAAMLSAEDRRRFDGGFGFAPDAPGFDAMLQELAALRSSHSDLLLTGEAGTGRKTWARLVHQAGGPSRPSPPEGLVIRSAFSLEADGIQALGGDGDVKSLAISELEWLSPAAQAALLELCSRPIGQRPRILATVGGRAGDDHGVHPQLRRLLGRVTVRRPALRQRRHWIPASLRFLLDRIADREGVSPLVLEDAAIAHLWRQPWSENYAGLEAVLYSLVMHVRRTVGDERGVRPGESQPMGVGEVEAALSDSGLDSVPRLPSRSPSMGDLAAALWTTRTATCRVNKTRAALYLGWDPNTLSLRLKEGKLKSLEQVRSLLSQPLHSSE
jgi:hypothetical protein